MIIGAASSLLSGTAIDRGTRVGASAAAAEPAPAEAAADDPLARLENFVESAAQSRKAFAEDRLKHLKEQMNTLALFNLAPGFLAGHSARMAKELESAAKDFAGSFKTLAELGRAAPTDPPLPAAYAETMDAGMPAPLKMKPEDAETAASFANTALRLRFVVDLAEEADRGRGNAPRTAEAARESTFRVVDLMARLEGPATTAAIFR